MEQPSSIEDLLAGANGLPDRSLPRPHGPGEIPPRPDLLAETTGTVGVSQAEPAHFLQLAGGPFALVHDPQDVAGLCCPGVVTRGAEDVQRPLGLLPDLVQARWVRTSDHPDPGPRGAP
jgi:hypothetical protein